MFDEFDETITQVEIRVLDVKKKSKFVKRRAHNFPVVDTVEDFREAIKKAFPDLESESLPKFKFGYVGDKNKKYCINNDLELKEGYDNAMKGNPFWIDIFESIDRKVNLAQTQSSARTMPETESAEETIKSTIETLKRKHGEDSQPPYKFRLWAEMVRLGSATVDTVPDAPMFRIPAKRPRQAASSSSATDSSYGIDHRWQRVSEPVESETTKRTETLKQIKELFDLKGMGAITEDEYTEKKQNLLKYL